CASCGSLRSDGNTLGVTRIGTSRSWLKPKASACSCSASAPICTASEENGVLHETRSASVSVAVVPLPHTAPPGLRIGVDVPGGGYSVGAGTSESGVYSPASRIIARSTSLKVDPGGYRSPAIVRLTIGSSGSPSSSCHASLTALVECPASTLGS